MTTDNIDKTKEFEGGWKKWARAITTEVKRIDRRVARVEWIVVVLGLTVIWLAITIAILF